MCRLQIQYRQGAAGLFVAVVCSFSYILQTSVPPNSNMPYRCLKCNECPNDDRVFDIHGQAPMSLEHIEEIEEVRARDMAAQAVSSLICELHFLVPY